MTENQLAFYELVEHLDLGAFRLKPGLREKFLFVNAAFAGMLSYAPAELLREDLSGIFIERRKIRAAYRKVVESGTFMIEEIGLRRKTGASLVVSLLLVAVVDARKRLKYIDGIVKNISTLKHAEQRQQESKELFESVFNNSAAAIIVMDREARILAWNPFAEKMLGMDKRDLFNKPFPELFPAKQWQKLSALPIWDKEAASEIEAQIHNKDGADIDINMFISYFNDSSGGRMGSVALILDVSRQKTAERRIRESENKIRIILDNSAAAITMTDAQERIVSWNKFTEEMLGKTREELYLKPVSSLYPPAEWEKIRGARIREKGAMHHLETKVLGHDASVIDVDLSVTIIKDSNGEITGSVGIMQDITRQKKIHQELLRAKIMAEEANSAKSMFLANMSHEVRTPMNTIMGMLDLTLDTPLTDEQRENLTTIKSAADILLSLLNDILDLSRVEAGKLQLERIELNIENIIRSVCTGLSVLARKKDLALVWDVDPGVPGILIGDPIRLRQILVNLINNAIKFAFRGEIKTKVTILALDDKMCELQFSVADQGIGIAQDKLQSIFEVFSQADTSTTRKFGGTGLGLAISSRLVDLMGGRIWVESEEYKGSTFWFTAKFMVAAPQPAPPVEAAPLADAMSPPLAAGLEPGHLRILLAEDNIVNQKIAVRMLEKRGWTVQTADNGKQVLERLDEEEFDVILMDAQMPLMDGYEATKRIREREAGTEAHIPIIALTARAMSGDRKRCMLAGMDGYVTKPIDREKLFETILGLFNIPTNQRKGQ
ncbi:MAG TPA: PAS domain S-box protein [Candidatus Omnitrophota bacterium]|nr:PAS domain S-box protein [Candidatus Omnitrophota bacterium]